MRSFTPHRLWSLLLGLPLACGTASDGADDSIDFGAELDTASGLKAQPFTFIGGGTSGAALALSAALAPESKNECDPGPTSTLPETISDVQTVCFYGDDAPNVPAATIEQVVEVVGNEEWVHLRLTLNPDFVDNTYGDNAIGWDDDDAAEPAPPGGVAPPPPPGAGEPPPLGAMLVLQRSPRSAPRAVTGLRAPAKEATPSGTCWAATTQRSKCSTRTVT